MKLVFSPKHQVNYTTFAMVDKELDQLNDKISQTDALSRLIDSYHKQPKDTTVAAESVEL